MTAFPPRLPEQPIFYPVTTEDYAVKIARDWNVPASGAGFVTKFEVQKAFLDRYEIQDAGGKHTKNIGYPLRILTPSTVLSWVKLKWCEDFPNDRNVVVRALAAWASWLWEADA